MSPEKYRLEKYAVLFLILFILSFVLFVTFMTLYLTKSSTDQTSNMLSLKHQQEFDKNVADNKKKISQQRSLYEIPQNPFDKFDCIYYINMDNRPDRKIQVEAEMRKMNIPFDKVQRVSGVKAKFGALGCSKAHLNCLLDCRSRNLQNCLIIEDDFMFKFGRDHTYSQLHRFWNLNLKWDVLMLSSFTRQFEKTSLDFLIKVTEGQTTAGYAVHHSFLQTLIENFQQGIAELEKYDAATHDNCIDQFWKQLQSPNRWYTFHPVMAHQRDSFSDIEQKDVNYKDKYEVVEEIDNYEYLICVKTCLPRLRKNAQQIEALNYLSKQKNKIKYFFYYGDPYLNTPFTVDDETHVVTLRCQDDYLNLCHKFGMMIYFLNCYISLNKTCQNLKGIFFTDDDIELKSANFYDFLKAREDHEYWGYLAKHDDLLSDHLMTKAKESPSIQQFLLDHYPELLKYKIAVSNTAYFCPGGGFYVSMTGLAKLSLSDNLFEPFPSETGLQYHKVTEDGKTIFRDLCVFDDLNVGIAFERFHIKPISSPIHEIVYWPGLLSQ